MKVVVDGGELHSELAVSDWDSFIKTVCNELLEKDLGVIRVSVDGAKLPVFSIDELSKFDVTKVAKVDIEAQNIYESIKSILQELMSILPETEHFHGQVAAMINEGKEQDSMRVLELILKYWQNLIQVVKTISEISAVKKIELPNVNRVSSEFEHLNEISQSIKESIHSGDFVNIADTVDQVLKPKIWEWRKIIEELYDFMADYPHPTVS